MFNVDQRRYNNLFNILVFISILRDSGQFMDEQDFVPLSLPQIWVKYVKFSKVLSVNISVFKAKD